MRHRMVKAVHLPMEGKRKEILSSVPDKMSGMEVRKRGKGTSRWSRLNFGMRCDPNSVPFVD